MVAAGTEQHDHFMSTQSSGEKVNIDFSADKHLYEIAQEITLVQYASTLWKSKPRLKVSN